jgi:hypothetical protein
MHRGGWALAFVLMACGAGSAERAPASPESEPTPGPIVIALDNTESSDVLSVLSEVLDEPVLVDAMSLRWLRCITVTVHEPLPLPRKVAAQKLFDALRAQGVRIDRLTYSKRDGATWMVKLDARPASCAPADGEVPAASEAAADGDAGAIVPDAGVPEGQAAREAALEAAREEVLRSIREISPAEHAIARHGLDVLAENEAVLMRSARIVPEEVNGKVAGIRLFGVRPDGVLGRLGLENGDRIDRVMGKSIASPEQALEVYAALRAAKVIEIEVVRRGIPKKLTVRGSDPRSARPAGGRRAVGTCRALRGSESKTRDGEIWVGPAAELPRPAGACTKGDRARNETTATPHPAAYPSPPRASGFAFGSGSGFASRLRPSASASKNR